MRTIHGLWAMSRPLQIVAVVLVYGLGALVARALSGSQPGTDTLLIGLLALVPTAASIHYANEYADFETDALTDPTPFSGGSGAIPAGLVSRGAALGSAWVTLCAGLGIAGVGLAGSWLSPEAVGLLVIGVFFGWMYSLPPLKLAWRGWGELDNALLGGMALPLYGYAAASGEVDILAVLAFAPFTMLVFLNLLATTWPDRRADAQVGKRTLATRFPADWLRWLYGAGAVLALSLLGKAVVFGAIPASVAWVSLGVVPLVVWGAWRYTRTEFPAAGVVAMVALLLAQMAGWLSISY